MRRFFLPPDAAEGPTAVLTGGDARHIVRVLRLKPGDIVELVDGKGGRYTAEIENLSGGAVRVAIGEKTEAGTESPLSLTLALGYLKDKKMDRLVRQTTELGVAAFLPFFADRSIPNPSAGKLADRKKRWEKIAREAVKQCGRGRIPEIGPPTDYETMLKASEACDLKVLFWESADAPLPSLAADFQPSPPKTALVVVGPEGGLTEREAAAARDCGFHPATLGPRILRAETAAVTACALVQYLFGDLSGKKA